MNHEKQQGCCMPLKPEQIEQIKLFAWIKSRKDLEPFCFSIPNERRVSPQHGFMLKKMGLKAGVSDIFCAIAKGHYHGMFLELKAGYNKPNELQIKFMDDMTHQGYYATWCKGYEKARELMEYYLEL